MKTIIGLAVALLLIPAGVASAAEWGAIAFSQSTGATGYSYNWPSEVDAEITALDECANYANDCITAVNFHDACGALAVGSNSGWGGDWGQTRAAAERAALRRCRQYDSGCRIVRWQCSY